MSIPDPSHSGASWPARGYAVALAALGIACAEAVGPSGAVDLRTEVAPAIAAVGDEVVLRAILHNPTGGTIEMNGSCGPPVLFEVRGATGAAIHPIPLDGIFTCPLLDVHVLEPGETDTVSTRWRPATAGTFDVRSGFRGREGLTRLTSPVTLTVR